MPDEKDVTHEHSEAHSDSAPTPQTLDYRRGEIAQKWVTIGKYDPFEGQLAMAKLHANGIPAQLYDQNAAAVYAGILGSAKLQVAEEDVGRAKELLAKRADVTNEEDY